ncbi:MAG: hypothetical protein JJU02_16155 [Cryomorphaceae bacterium]|nr:hypothetical protein [Cryomorphaceae bacterium]
MRKFLTFIAASLILYSCENYQEENEALKLSLEKLQNEKIEQEMLMDDFSETMALIQQNLQEIRDKEGNIENLSLSKEGLRNSKDEIIDDLDVIRKKMEENKNSLEDLKKKMAGSHRQNANMRKMVDQMTLEIAKKDSSIEVLRLDLENKNFQIAKLKSEMDYIRERKERELQEKEDLLNMAYYIAGDYKTLEEKGVVDKSGGFIGIGRVKTLQDDLDKSEFTAIDKRTFSDLMVGKRKAELLSTHPAHSYQWEKEDKNIVRLIILDKEAFWKSSKTMVLLWD